MTPNEPRTKSETPATNTNPTQTASRSREMMCTHITMVRMYSVDMRCSMCLHPGPFGWVYRCSQDRELMIENDYNENGVVSCSGKLPVGLILVSDDKIV